MTIDTPYLHALLDKSFVSNEDGFIECYVFACTLFLNRPLLFTAHLENGALYSNLPLKAFRTLEFNGQYSDIEEDPWGSISTEGHAIRHKYLKDYRVLVNESFVGHYLYSISYICGDFAEDPRQGKQSHIIGLQCGKIVAYPNNNLLFIDDHFVNKDAQIKLKRNTRYFRL